MPYSIKLAQNFFYAAILTGAISSIRALTSPLPIKLSTSMYIGVFLIGGFYYWFLYRMVKALGEGKPWARWMNTINFVFNFFFGFSGFFTSEDLLGKIITITGLIVTGFGLRYLFSEDSQAWLKAQKK